MMPLIRSLVYASLFMAFILVFLPLRLLEFSGVQSPTAIGITQFIGGGITITGGALAVWCVLTFALAGRGTPAPFDPPRRLVVAGPYRWVRNPMYIGAGISLLGAGIFYGSVVIFSYAAFLYIISHLFIVMYEEPTLESMFGEEYRSYRRHVSRWLPRPPRQISDSPF